MAMSMTMAMAMAPQVVPCADFKKSTFLNRKRNIFVKKHKNRANLVSGVPKSESTRNSMQDTPNESSGVALGASLVTKQACRLPQHDYINEI